MSKLILEMREKYEKKMKTLKKSIVILDFQEKIKAFKVSKSAIKQSQKH